MNFSLKISLIVLLVIQLFLIIGRMKKKKMTIKYACFWIILVFIMALVVIFPETIFKLSEKVGFVEPSNMVLLLGFFFLFYLSFIITTSISIQNEKIKTLIQEVSLLKERVNEYEKRR